MNIDKYIMLPVLILGLVACESKKSHAPVHFRALAMIQYTSATLAIQGKGSNHSIHCTWNLAYAKSNSYQSFPPGHYEIMLRVKGKPLLKGRYVLGEDGYYTLLAVGLQPAKWKVNPKTFMYNLKHIFAGEELESTNKYLPQWFMMRDNYNGSNASAYIRFVNANPATPTLTIKEDNNPLKNGLAYPIESGMIKVSPGAHTLRAYYGKINVGKQSFRAKAGYIYTAIAGGSKRPGRKVILRILKNPSRTLLNSK